MAKKIDFPKHLTGRTYATIREAFDKASPEKGIHESGYMTLENCMPSINLSSIFTKIIQDVGRFAERYASDMLYDLDHIRELCESTYPLEQDIDEIFVMGIRQNGVDGNNFFMSRLVQTLHGPIDSYVHPEHAYRRILAVRVKVSCERNGCFTSRPVIDCELRNLTNEFLFINQADIDGGTLIAYPFENGNPVPIRPYVEGEPASVGENQN